MVCNHVGIFCDCSDIYFILTMINTSSLNSFLPRDAAMLARSWES